jgi:hypothetical protein
MAWNVVYRLHDIIVAAKSVAHCLQPVSNDFQALPLQNVSVPASSEKPPMPSNVIDVNMLDDFINGANFLDFVPSPLSDAHYLWGDDTIGRQWM